MKGITPLPRPTRILVKHGGMKPVRKTLEKKRENDEEAWNSKKGYPQRPHYWHGVGLLLDLHIGRSMATKNNGEKTVSIL